VRSSPPGPDDAAPEWAAPIIGVLGVLLGAAVLLVGAGGAAGVGCIALLLALIAHGLPPLQ